MAVNLLLHPIVGLFALALLLAAFTAKVRTRKQYVVHYALGLSSLALSSLAFALGFLTVSRRRGKASSSRRRSSST